MNFKFGGVSLAGAILGFTVLGLVSGCAASVPVVAAQAGQWAKVLWQGHLSPPAWLQGQWEDRQGNRLVVTTEDIQAVQSGNSLSSYTTMSVYRALSTQGWTAKESSMAFSYSVTMNAPQTASGGNLSWVKMDFQASDAATISYSVSDNLTPVAASSPVVYFKK